MHSIFSPVLVLLILPFAATVSLRAEHRAAAGPTAPTQGEASYLMLQDGGLLEGKVTAAADWYIVQRSGGQIQIAKSRVIFACRTLEDAYAYRREQIKEAKAQPHLALAEWCLRYGLLPEAEHELAAARRLDSDHPRLTLLEVRLAKMRSQPIAKSKSDAPLKAQARNSGEPVINPSTTIDLPDGVVERFTRKVQPILVNSCTTSACHQPGGRQSFQLDRAILRGEANRRSTMHNLKATLALVDSQSPERSALLIIGRKKHGGMAGPIFGPRQEQAFKHVSEWVSLVAPPANTTEGGERGEDTTPAMAPSDAREAGTQVSRTNAKRDKGDERSTDRNNSRTPATQAAMQSPVIEAAEIADDKPRTLREPHHLLYGGRLQPWQARDPFDPEIFNRLQRARPDSVQDAAQPTVQQTPQLQPIVD